MTGSNGRGPQEAFRLLGSGRGRNLGSGCVAMVSWITAIFCLVTGASSALAAPKSVDRFIGGALGGAAGQFLQPRGVAVNDSTGDIYVAEGNHRIARYSSEGVFELMWGRGVDDGTAAAQTCTAGTVPCQAGTAGTLKGEFNTPVGLAVDQSDGSVYTVDQANRRVQKFTPDGAFVLMFGDGVNQTTGGDVCSAASGDVCKIGVTGAGPAQFGNALAVIARMNLAVHPITGEVFVADTANRRVMQFEADGDFVRAWGYDVDTAGVVGFEICAVTCRAGQTTNGGVNPGQWGSSQPQSIAVDADGIVYTSDVGVGNRIIRFDSDGFGTPAAALLPDILATDQGPPPGGGVLLAGRPTTALSVDSATGNLLVVRDPSSGETLVQEIDPSDASPVDVHGTGAGLTTVQGIAYDPARARIVLSYATSNPGQGFFLLDGDGPSSPSLTVEPPTSVTSTGATLHGTINPNGFAQYRFEYSADGVTWESQGGFVSKAGVTTDPISQVVTGLRPNTLYRVRVLARSTVGGDANGPPPTLTTESAEAFAVTDAAAPAAVTLPPSPRTATSARFQGTINPNGSVTTYYFEYGRTTGYGRTAPVPEGFAGSGATDVLVATTVGDLIPSTVYHYRVVARNTVGTVFGPDVTFTTRSEVGGPPARGYEQASPSHKTGGVGVGQFSRGDLAAIPPGLASLDGESYMSASSYGAPLLDGCPFAYANDFARASRTSIRWVPRCVFTRPNFGSAELRFGQPASASDDLSLALFTSNGGRITPFSEMGDWPQPIGAPALTDSLGRWEVFGPTDLSQGNGDPGATGRFAVAAGGSAAAMTVPADGSPLAPRLRGLAGDDDPTWNQATGATTYIHEPAQGGLSDTFPGTGVRSPLGVCTTGTLIPDRLVSGLIGARACDPPQPGRSAALIDGGGASLGTLSLQRVLSSSGARAFFMSPDPDAGPASCTAGTGIDTECPAQLYARQKTGAGDVLVRWISKTTVANQSASLMAPTLFEGASADGDKVFFRTIAPLTADDPNGAGAPVPGGVTAGVPSSTSSDLYMYDFPDAAGADPADGTLTRVSAGPTGSSDANARGTAFDSSLRFVSADGSRAYFLTAAPLAGTSAAYGTITTPGGAVDDSTRPNLYFYDATNPPASRWTFVARLTSNSPLGKCSTLWAEPGDALIRNSTATGVGPETARSNCMRGTLDGRFLTFFTDARLVGGDPDTSSGDIYAFDAGAGELERVSAPQGRNVESYTCIQDLDTNGIVGDTMQCHGDQGIGAGGIREIGRARLGVATDAASPGVHMAYFQSKARLVAEDTDDHYDVYEWRNGVLSLVSVNTDQGAYYASNSSDGEDVFFMTRDTLSWQDLDAVMDVYDARSAGGYDAPLPVTPICNILAGECRGAVAQPMPVPPIVNGDGMANTPNGSRLTATLRSVSRKTRRRAARTGVLPVKIDVSAPGTVRVVAKSRLGARKQKVGTARLAVGRAGVATARLRLRAAARGVLRRGRRLTVSVTALPRGGRPSTVTVVLRQVER